MVSTAERPGVEAYLTPRTASRFVLVVEYDGTAYCGFQLQADRPTVQAALETALKALTGAPTRVSASSRTDSGVHARGQVVSFKTDAALPVEAYVHGLNHHLPCDVAVKAAYEVAPDFNARGMAASREYTYTILESVTRSPLRARTAHRVNGPLDTGAMNAACALLLGAHDFASFASDIGGELEKSTVRRVFTAEVARDHDLVTFRIVASAFVRHQVRNTAGALVQVGMGRMGLTEFANLLAAKKPGLAGPTLPACGLCLVRVSYPSPLWGMSLLKTDNH